MKIRLFITTMFTVLLAGCGATSPHPDCSVLQQAERQNAKDLEAYCFTEQTQDSLKCEQAKNEQRTLQVARERIAQGSYPEVLGSYLPCPQQF